ncbi:MAG: hypothetical protein H7Y88_13670 [Phycisphaerales bacterium]|nr:hypothetical protein [Phycisphaerales bacterium]
MCVSIRAAACVAAAGLCAPVLAQPQDFQDPISSTGFFGNGNPIGANLATTETVGLLAASLRARGDWSFMLARENGEFGAPTSAFRVFECGPIPVRLQDMTFTAHAKWVNGGGTNTIPETRFDVNAAIRERVGALPSFNDPIILGLGSINNPLIGNGLTVYNEAFGGPGLGPVLAAGRTYYVEMLVRTRITVTGFTEFTPSITVTNEFGGDLSQGVYDGFEVIFGYRTVPAPSVAAMLLPLGLVASRRRR